MKIKNIYNVYMYLPLIITLATLVFLPEKMPIHYGVGNEVAYASKYASLVIPILTLFIGYFILLIVKCSEKEENMAKLCIKLGLFTVIIFNVLSYFSIYVGLNKVKNLSELPINVYKIIFAVIGFLIILIGNNIQDANMNSLIGLRTPWSIKNEVIWGRSQHFGGVTFIIIGVIILIENLFYTGFKCLFVAGLTFLVGLSVDVFYTYKEAKKLIS